MGDLRIGVLGFGLRSGLARYANRPDEGSRIAAVCDPRPERQAVARERLGGDIAVTGELDEFLAAKLHAAFILSPDYMHEQHAIAVLEAGAAAYVEKPMASMTEGCDAMLATAARTGSRLYVGHNMRHMPVIRQMRQLVADGAIGANDKPAQIDRRSGGRQPVDLGFPAMPPQRRPEDATPVSP